MNTTTMRAVERWREQYNPLRGLTIGRAISLLDAYQRGEMADLQWCYYFVEQTDPDLFALVERRTSAIRELDWDIKQPPPRKRRRDFDPKLADDQAAALREAYDRIDNLNEALEHLALATFRGYAHLEKHMESRSGRAPEVNHLEILDQWNAVRDGMFGEWKYNPGAKLVTYDSAPGSPLDPDRWVIRERRRHVNRIGLIKFIRQNLGQKDWDAFVEIYGLPRPIIVGPANVPEGKEAEYETAAERVANGAGGYLPNGSEVKYPDGVRGTAPFKEYMDHLTEKMILVGTGGMLTMLTQSGSGTLAGGAHQDTFEQLARAEAADISEVLQRSIDARVLDREFPGRPRLAYFQLAAIDEEDVNDIVERASKLATAGFQLDPAELSEKVGLKISLASPQQEDEATGGPDTRAGGAGGDKEAARSGPGGPGAKTDPPAPDPAGESRNRAGGGKPGSPEPATGLVEAALAEALGVVPAWLAPVARELAGLEAKAKDATITNDDLVAATQDLAARLPDLLAELSTDDLALVIESAMGTATVEGVSRGVRDRHPPAP